MIVYEILKFCKKGRKKGEIQTQLGISGEYFRLIIPELVGEGLLCMVSLPRGVYVYLTTAEGIIWIQNFEYINRPLKNILREEREIILL
ncbi:MAG: hypothetical protein DRJ03_12205 [Chloroflexi bacterium]|nr:MAG: hypothetical protein DRJ03_12170 [Chloroflexota bacterium]RLC85262.1 MAG: hypothetical protein DRJ03_12205 [Chloroflexota bacterium]